MATRSKSKQTISRDTRRDILDALAVDGVDWSGRLEEPSFLGRIWDLSDLPSTDHRFPNAEADIWQHRIRNPEDWDADWVFSDGRFDLLGCPDEIFVRFLCEMLHPLVRPDRDEVEGLLTLFNECLEDDDWEIVATKRRRSGPVFEGRQRESLKSPTVALDLDRYARLDDPQVVRDHLRRIDRDLKSDPPGAIGASKELVESVMKKILDDYGVGYKGDDLGDLYKKVQNELHLNAEAVPDNKKGSEAAVKTLRSLVSTIQSLAELRNQIGSGHGRNKSSVALTRHARLAFNASVTVVEFLLDTWHVRRQDADQ
jgi:AbiJ N-terminal domain 3/Abortive infection C-terminus